MSACKHGKLSTNIYYDSLLSCEFSKVMRYENIIVQVVLSISNLSSIHLINVIYVIKNVFFVV